jgi:hypothetical protein
MITSVTSPSVLSFSAMENKCFISTKTPESRRARRDRERVPNPSLSFKLHRLRKCANTNKCSSPCARVLVFSQSFSSKELDTQLISPLDPNTYAKLDRSSGTRWPICK